MGQTHAKRSKTACFRFDFWPKLVLEPDSARLAADESNPVLNAQADVRNGPKPWPKEVSTATDQSDDRALAFGGCDNSQIEGGVGRSILRKWFERFTICLSLIKSKSSSSDTRCVLRLGMQLA